MKSMHFASIIKLNERIFDIQGLVNYWVGVGIAEPNRLKEILGRIAELKADLASLRMERKAFFSDMK